MCPGENRSSGVMHEAFIVIKSAAGDMGSRPLNGPFASPDLTVGADGRPRAVVWNLGNREASGVVIEFATLAAGLAMRPEHVKPLGQCLANIPSANSVTVTCPNIWQRGSQADVLLVTAYHPTLDPIKAAVDPKADRHHGQMNYPWAGHYEGRCSGADGLKLAVQIRPANGRLFRVKLFIETNGRLPSNPQIDRVMAPNGATFRWQEHYHHAYTKEDWYLVMLDNARMSVRCLGRVTDGSDRGDSDLSGAVERIVGRE